MHTFYQRYPSEHRWTKDHPLEQVIGNPSQSVRTRRQLESDAEMCMFALIVSRTEPKNIKEAMADSAWIESMQEELHQFDRLDVWELVDRPLCTNVINLKWLWKKNAMKRILLFETNLVWWLKDMRKRKELILKNHSHPLLGIQIHQSPRGIFIKQAKYAQEMLKKHDHTKYRSKVGALMYLTASRPDIMHATCYCARYQAQPTEKHLTAVKRIFRYLKDTIHMGLWYLKDTSFELTTFLDSDHAGCLDSHKSKSGGIQFLEAEYVSLSACCTQVLWMRTQLTDYGFHFDKIPMYCDSKTAIAISCNPVQHSHTKHIDVRYHFIKEKVEKDLDTMSIDDLYNNFRIVEQEVKGTVTASSSSGSQNIAFLSSPGSTNEVDTANIQVSTVSTPVSTVSTHDNTANLSDVTVYAFLANQLNRSQLVHEDIKQIHKDDIEEMDLKWQLDLLSMRARRYFQRTGKKITGSDTAGYDKTNVECFNFYKMVHFARECRSPRNQESRPRNQNSSIRTVNVEDTSSKAMVAINEACFD
nr:hypothetical protein [Tanacetum cinerariifolium]